jgi:hypothetical protein
MKGLKIDWGNVFRLADGEKLQGEIQGEKRGEMRGETRGEISERLYSPIIHNPPPPSPTLSAAELVVVGILKSHVCDANVREDLARRFTDEVADVVAEFELNRHLFRDGGAIKYRLEAERWPTSAEIRCIHRHRELAAAAESQRLQKEAEDREREAEQAVLVELDAKHGVTLDSMEWCDLEPLARSAIDESDWEAYRKWPGMFRWQILEAMEVRI